MDSVYTERPLPAGLTSRPPGLTDAEAIFELVTAYNTAIIGFADYTLDDVRDELVEPGFDPGQDARLVFTGDALVGYGWTFRQPGSDQIDVDVVAADPAVAHWLLDNAIGRARAIGREHGYAEVTVDQGIYRANDPMRELSTSYGFEPSTTYHRMRIDHDGPAVPVPAPPAGTLLRTGDQDESVRRAGYDVVMASFTDHFGHVETTYDEWVKAHEAKSTFDWSQLAVIEVDGKPVAMSETTGQFVEDEDCGYVAKLGVLREARGQGLASYLLRRVFALDSAAGRAGTLLHVDTNNTTPALGLYLSVGMTPVLVIDVWRRKLTP